jgi:hypothetical protein
VRGLCCAAGYLPDADRQLATMAIYQTTIGLAFMVPPVHVVYLLWSSVRPLMPPSSDCRFPSHAGRVRGSLRCD